MRNTKFEMRNAFKKRRFLIKTSFLVGGLIVFVFFMSVIFFQGKMTEDNEDLQAIIGVLFSLGAIISFGGYPLLKTISPEIIVNGKFAPKLFCSGCGHHIDRSKSWTCGRCKSTSYPEEATFWEKCTNCSRTPKKILCANCDKVVLLTRNTGANDLPAKLRGGFLEETLDSVIGLGEIIDKEYEKGNIDAEAIGTAYEYGSRIFKGENVGDIRKDMLATELANAEAKKKIKEINKKPKRKVVKTELEKYEEQRKQQYESRIIAQKYDEKEKELIKDDTKTEEKIEESPFAHIDKIAQLAKALEKKIAEVKNDPDLTEEKKKDFERMYTAEYFKIKDRMY